jgi:uncharacterized protein
MLDQGPSFLRPVFRRIIAARWWIIVFWALLLGPSIFYALKVGQDNSLDRLIVQTDPDYIASKEFEAVFGRGEYVVLLADVHDPFDPKVLGRIDQLERALAALPRVKANSLVSIYRRARAGFSATPEEAAALKRFATGSRLFRKQGLFGERFLAIPLVLTVKTGEERAEALGAIDRVLAGTEKNPAPLLKIRKVGQPYVNLYLDADTRAVGMRYFPFFGLFVVVLILSLYRSFRALFAFIAVLAVSAAVTVGYVGVTGGVFTIVSSLVPMTILITCTATLVYLHSRFVDQPEDKPLEEHHVDALVNKFIACSASLFATGVGFAALTVSRIRPIREMGISVAVGMLVIWLVAFTLFPALQRVLRTPTQKERRVAVRWFTVLTRWLPGFTYRWRWALVSAALLVSAAGAVALFGLPGVVSPMRLLTNPVDYINSSSELYKNTKQLEELTAGLAVTEVWLKGDLGSVSKPEVVRGLSIFEEALEKEPSIGAVIGLVTMLKMLRYTAGKGDRLPEDPEELEEVTDSFEALLPKEPMLQGFVEKTNLDQTHLMIITRTHDYEGYIALDKLIRARWAEAAKRVPALKVFKQRIVGLAPLTAKISYNLVPTLTESFGLTVAIIFGTFLLVFRSGAARLMAMIPSLFAILAMFGFMRLTGMSLNVATIIIASTVLGATENDQIHFFYHFLEPGKSHTTEEKLRHAFLISGRAIFFATLINASGFLAFAMADLPPIKHFGILSALAFLLSMIADFTALPAALWMIFRQKPDEKSPSPPPEEEQGQPRTGGR